MASNPPNSISNHHSAVLVLYEQRADALVLTKRSKTLQHHPGEICFPGGRWEEQDANYYETALREVYEEIGIEAKRITRVRKLQTELTLSGVMIHPWLCEIEQITPFHLNVQEVSKIILIPMSQVVDASHYSDFFIERDGVKIKNCRFIDEREVIWGATARIMMQLIAPRV